MFRWLLVYLGLCAHPLLLRERRRGIPYYVCPDCGYAVPVLRRVK